MILKAYQKFGSQYCWQLIFIATVTTAMILCKFVTLDYSLKRLLCESILISTYLFVLLSTIKIKSLYSLQSIFLFTFGLFLLARIPLHLIQGKDYSIYYGSFGTHYWSRMAQLKTLFYLNLFLIIFYFTLIMIEISSEMSVLGNKKSEKLKQFSITKNYSIKQFVINVFLFDKIEFFNVSKLLFLLSFPFAIALSIMEYLQVKNIGYVAYYTTTLAVPRFLELTRFIFQVSYFGIVASVEKKKAFFIYSFFYFLFIVADALKGGRMALASFTLFVVCYSWLRFGISLKKRYASTAIILGFPLLQYLNFARTNQTNLFSIFGSFSSFLYDNGVSLNAVGLYITNKNRMPLHDYPYVFEPIVRIWELIQHPFLRSGGQSLEIITVRFNLAHHLSFKLNSTAYFKGAGIGSSFIAELSEFGEVGIIVGTILLTLGIHWISSNINYYSLLRYFSLLIISHLFIMSRAEYFLDTYTFMKFLIGYALLLIISNFYYRFVIIKNNGRVRNSNFEN